MWAATGMSKTLGRSVKMRMCGRGWEWAAGQAGQSDERATEGDGSILGRVARDMFVVTEGRWRHTGVGRRGLAHSAHARTLGNVFGKF